MTEGPFRVGGKVPLNLYDDRRPRDEEHHFATICQCHSVADAVMIAEALNAQLAVRKEGDAPLSPTTSLSSEAAGPPPQPAASKLHSWTPKDSHDAMDAALNKLGCAVENEPQGRPAIPVSGIDALAVPDSAPQPGHGAEGGSLSPDASVTECPARTALSNLVSQLDAVHQDERYKSVWMLHMIHGGNYTGPKYEKELTATRVALELPCPCDQLRTQNERLRSAHSWMSAEKHSAQADTERHKNTEDRLRLDLHEALEALKPFAATWDDSRTNCCTLRINSNTGLADWERAADILKKHEQRPPATESPAASIKRPPADGDILARLRATQCCDTVIDSLLGAAIGTILSLRGENERLRSFVRPADLEELERESEIVANYVQKIQPGAHSVYEVLDLVPELASENGHLRLQLADAKEAYRVLAESELLLRDGRSACEKRVIRMEQDSGQLAFLIEKMRTERDAAMAEVDRLRKHAGVEVKPDAV